MPALLLWVPLIAFSWGTLCLGSDGHLALEPSVLGRCIDGGEAPAAAPPAALHLSCEGCGPCLDVAGADALCPSRGEPDGSVALPGVVRVAIRHSPPIPPRGAADRADHPRRSAQAPPILRC